MITPARSIFIGVLAGLLGLSVCGFVVTVLGHRDVTTADFWPAACVFIMCGAWVAYKTERADIDRQKASDDVTLKERLARIAPAPVAAQPEPAPGPDPAEEDEWYTHTLRPMFTNGHRAGGFSHGLLGRTMVEDDWADLCKFYVSEAGRRVLRLEPGSVGYVLNTPTWTHAAVMREIVNHTLPHPEGLAPDVSPLTDDATRRAARRGETVGQGGGQKGSEGVTT